MRHVYVDEARAPRAAAPGGEGAVAGVAGRLPEQAAVRGHLKRQPHGPGGTLRKWIWVESSGAPRWVAPRPARVVVH